MHAWFPGVTFSFTTSFPQEKLHYKCHCQCVSLSITNKLLIKCAYVNKMMVLHTDFWLSNPSKPHPSMVHNSQHVLTLCLGNDGIAKFSSDLFAGHKLHVFRSSKSEHRLSCNVHCIQQRKLICMFRCLVVHMHSNVIRSPVISCLA